MHDQHAGQGWGGGSYSVMIADDGTIVLLSPAGRKAAHVAGHNTGKVGVNCPGGPGDEATAAQRASLRWYLARAHTRAIPKPWRQPRDLRTLTSLVHRDLNATACPGRYTSLFRAA